MLKDIFQKTLYAKRWMALWWTVLGAAFTLFIISFFHTMQDSLGASLNNVPESMKSLLGDAQTYQHLPSYVNIQLFEQMIFLPIALAITLFTGLLAGEEKDGTLQTLLAQPVSRSQVYWQKFAAGTGIVAISIAIAFFASTLLGALFIGEDLSVSRLAVTCASAFIISMFFGVLGYAIGAITGKRGLAAAVAGGFAFVSFVVTSIVEGVKGLKALDYFSPFHYYNHPSPLEGALSWPDNLGLIVVAVVLAIAGWLVFRKRDIYNR